MSGAKFEHVVENMRTVCELFPTRSPATQLLVNGVALENDPSLVARTTAFVRSLGFTDEQMLFNLPHNFGGQYHGSPTDLNIGVNTYKDLRGLKPDLCSVLLHSPGVYVDGRVTACGCLDNSAALIIGDIKTQGFREMRHGVRFDALLKAFVNGDLSEVPLCDKCDVPYCGNNTKRAPAEKNDATKRVSAGPKSRARLHISAAMFKPEFKIRSDLSGEAVNESNRGSVNCCGHPLCYGLQP